MHLARVVGTVVAPHKAPDLEGVKLLVLEPLTPEREVAGPRLVGTDTVGAGVGEEVFYVRGREASLPFLPRVVATDCSIVGIVDHWSVSDADRGRS